MSDPPDSARDPEFEPASDAFQISGVWELTWPSMASFALHAVVGFVDLLFVAELGSDKVAGVGLATQFHFVALAIMAGSTTGTVALVARATGARDSTDSSRVTRASLLLVMIFCTGLTLLADAAGFIFYFFGLEPEVIAVADSYLFIVLVASIPLGISFVIGAAFRGAGDVRTPLVIGIIINIVNIIGDYALIFGHFGAPALGASGSAWASAIAFLVGAALFLALWISDRFVIASGPIFERADRKTCKRILRIGIPTALEQMAFSIGLFAFLRLVTLFGTEAVSAYMIGVRILAFSFVPGSGFAVAASTLVGQHLGAGDPDRAEHSGWRATQGGVLVMSAIGLLIVVFARPIADAFGAAGDETTRLTVIFIYILGAAQPLMAIEFSVAGALRGAGETRFPLFALLLGLFVFRLGAAGIVVFFLEGSLTALWSCLLMDYFVKATLLSLHFRRGDWKTLKL